MIIFILFLIARHKDLFVFSLRTLYVTLNKLPPAEGLFVTTTDSLVMRYSFISLQTRPQSLVLSVHVNKFKTVLHVKCNCLLNSGWLVGGKGGVTIDCHHVCQPPVLPTH